MNGKRTNPEQLFKAWLVYTCQMGGFAIGGHLPWQFVKAYTQTPGGLSANQKTEILNELGKWTDVPFIQKTLQRHAQTIRDQHEARLRAERSKE